MQRNLIIKVTIWGCLRVFFCQISDQNVEPGVKEQGVENMRCKEIKRNAILVGLLI